MLVLASASPRRADILASAGIPFVKQVAANVDETPRNGEDAREYVERLAREKALAIDVPPGAVVLGADTTVVLDGAILGKPEDHADATRMLESLAGRSHFVITGICLRSASGAI